jgi:hypothetical protein
MLAMNDSVNKCIQDTDAAKADCNQENDEGIQSAERTLSTFAVGTGSQMGIAAACTGIGKLVTGANAAVIYFSQNCSSARSKCLSSCQTAVRVTTASNQTGELTIVNQNLSSCRALDTNISQATQAIQNMVSTVQGAQSCATQTSPELMTYCGANPTAIGCANLATDCSNPAIAASNPICICKNNPSAANCTGLSAKAGGNGGSFDASSKGLGAGGSGLAGGASLGADNLLNDPSWQGDPNMKPSKGSGDEAGGSKGGRPLMDGGGGSGGGDDGRSGGAGGGQNGLAVNAGFRGGGGGGGWGSGSGSGNSGGDGSGRYGAEPGTQGNSQGPNLRDFLPGGGMDPKNGNRGLAGVSGPDGITGPNSNIWKKVQNRYQIHVERATLIP